MTNSNKTVRILDLTITINKPIDDVWKYLIDPKTITKYSADMSHGTVTLEDGLNDELCAGAKFTAIDNYKREFVEEVTTFIEPTDLETRVVRGPDFVGSTEKIHLKDVSEDGVSATELTFEWERSGSLFFRLIQKLQFYRNIYWKYKYDTDFKKLKEILEEIEEEDEPAATTAE